MSKVAFINALYTPNEIGGAERAVKILAERHVESGGEAVVITLARDGVARKDNVAGVTVHYVPLANIGFLHGGKPLPKWRRMIWHMIDSFNPIMMMRVYKILKAERPDVVEANNLQGFSVSAWVSAKFLGLPVVQVLHDYYLGCANSSMHKRSGNCDGQCVSCKALCMPRRLCDGLPNAVSSVSRRTLEKLKNHHMFESTDLVAITPSALRFDDIINDGGRAHRKAGEALVLGFIGRIDALKGVETLLQMMKRLQNLDVKLLIGGQGDKEYLDRLKTSSPDPRIHYLGFVHPKDFYQSIDVLLVPSLWEEPMTRVISEALANGRPAIVSRAGGSPEAIEDGVTGFVFEPGDDAGLAALVEKLWREDFPSDATSKACRESVGRYSTDSVYSRHHALWQRAIKAAA